MYAHKHGIVEEKQIVNEFKLNKMLLIQDDESNLSISLALYLLFKVFLFILAMSSN